MEKPEFLYHISNRLSEDESVLTPHKNVDITQDNEGNYVFASQKPNYISCFRGDFDSFLGGVTDIDGTSVIMIVTKNIEEVRNARRSKPSSIYKVSSENFTQVRGKSGELTDEWVSKEKVPILEKGKVTYEEILENAQVFYMETEKYFGMEQYNELVSCLKQRYSSIKEALRELVASGVIIYENGVTESNDRWLRHKQIETEER